MKTLENYKTHSVIMIIKELVYQKVWLSFMGSAFIVGGVVLLVAQPKPYLALLLPLIIPILLTLMHHPEYGYYLIIALIPLNAWQGLTEKYPFLTISKLVGIWIVLVLLIKIAIKPDLLNRLKTKLWYPLFGFLFINLISALHSEWFPSSILMLRQFVTAYLFLALTLFFVEEQQFKRIIPLIIVISTSISAFVAVVAKHLQIQCLLLSVKDAAISERAIGTANDPNFFAAMIIISLPLIANFFFTNKSVKVRFFLCVLFINNTYAIVITYSRAMMLVFTLIMVIIFLEHLRKLKLIYLGFFVLMLTVLMGLVVKELPKTAIWERMRSLSTPQIDMSLMRRASYIQVAKKAIMHKPFIGSGPDTFPALYEKSMYSIAFYTKQSGYTRAAHNTYLEIVVGCGILGLAFFLYTLCLSLRYFYKVQYNLRFYDEKQAAYVRSLAYSFISILFSFLFLSAVYLKYLWLFLGLSAVAFNLYKANRGTNGKRVQAG